MKNNNGIKDIIIRYFSNHFRFNQVFVTETTEIIEAKKKKRELKGSFKFLLVLLAFLPYLCLIGFVLSFFWDPGAGIEAEILGRQIGFDKLMATICVSGMIGYGTNYIAIHMLFKPVQRRPIWGQGLIPSQRNRIIYQLSRGMHKHILSEDLIKKRIHESGLISRLNHILVEGTRDLMEDKGFFKELKVFVHNYLTDYFSNEKVRDEFVSHIDVKLEGKLQDGFQGFLFKTYKRMSKDDYDLMLKNLIMEIPDTVVDAMERVEMRADIFSRWLRSKKGDMEEFMFKVVLDVLDRIDIRDLLARQMEHFDEAKLEKMIWTATNEQLRYIQLLGTFLGIMGGLLIWQPLVMVALYSVVIGLLLLLDIALFNLQKRKNEEH